MAVDAVLRTPRRIYIVGLKAGQSDAIFFDAAGRRIMSLDIRVGVDVAGLGDMAARLVPGARVRAEMVGDDYEASALTAREKAAIALADGYLGFPAGVDEDTAARVAAEFNDDEIASMMVALMTYNFTSRGAVFRILGWRVRW